MSMNIQHLINYYLNNVCKLKESIKLRKLDISIIETIDNLIAKLKTLSSEFNAICAQRKSESDKKTNILNRTKKKQIAQQADTTTIELRQKLLMLPNILQHDDNEDKTIETIVNSDKQGIKFTDFYRNYTYIHTERCLFYSGTMSIFKRRLANALIERCIRQGYTYIEVPLIVNNELMEHTGHLPKFRQYLFHISDTQTLIPTSEVTILEFISLECQKHKQLLSQKYACYSYCFRNETSAASKTNKSMIRQGVFEKVETFIVCKTSERVNAIQTLLNNVKDILNILKLNYRIVQVGTYNMSHSAYIQYDIEVYMPKSDMYVEIASCSDCGPYQMARNIKLRNYYNDFCTLNCSALPIDRLLACLVEYYWCETSQTIVDIDIDNLYTKI